MAAYGQYQKEHVMERPFDYPGMSEPTGFEPHQMRRSADNSIHHNYDDCGGNAFVITLWFAPDWWTDQEVSRAVAYLMPPEHCSHSHDCCGRYYARAGRVLSIADGHRDDHGDKCRLVIVGTRFVQNV